MIWCPPGHHQIDGTLSAHARMSVRELGRAWGSCGVLGPDAALTLSSDLGAQGCMYQPRELGGSLPVQGMQQLLRAEERGCL